MGVSTNAILFYGYCWDDEEDLLDGDDEWPQVIAIKRGETNPWDNYPPTIDQLPYEQRSAAGDKWCEENRAALDHWRAVEKAIESEFGCEIGCHCSDGCSMPYVAIGGAGLLARRGYPERIEQWPEIGADWDGKLDRFCKELGIEPSAEQKPGWWLVSYWG